jgi:hypothetical protein
MIGKLGLATIQTKGVRVVIVTIYDTTIKRNSTRVTYLHVCVCRYVSET